MKMIRLFFAAVLCVLLAGCHSKSYKITGTLESGGEGDTIFLTSDLVGGQPEDTAFLHNGKFSFSGETDSTYLCIVYSAREKDKNIPFFIEPGNIKVVIGKDPSATRVTGTSTNEKWQQLNDSIAFFAHKMDSIATAAYASEINKEKREAAMSQVETLQKRFVQCVQNAARRNIDNEFGYFIVTNYDDAILGNGLREELVKQMPDRFQERPAIKELKKIMVAQKTLQLSDVSMKDVNGQELRLMDEVKKHHVTIIDFWASWCAPCVQEMPNLVRLYKEYSQRGLGIIGVSLDSSDTDWQSAVDILGMTWPNVSELNGWKNSLAQQYGVKAIPFTMVVDSSGKILQKGLRGEQLATFVDEYLKACE